jgi:hypothetical protein
MEAPTGDTGLVVDFGRWLVGSLQRLFNLGAVLWEDMCFPLMVCASWRVDALEPGREGSVPLPGCNAKEKINFRIVQLNSMVVKSKYGSHHRQFTTCESHTPLLIVPPPNATKL